jgi:NAD(P)-dependent dehydrogenase (short-subunit alcohol dehydrogenase family)
MTRTDKAMLVLAAGGLGLWLFARRRPRLEYAFANKVVFITGGSRGLGLVLARALTREGARIGFCARDERELRIAADDLATLGAAPLAVRADVTDPAQIRAAIQRVEAERGPIDVLINNAGTIMVGPLSTMTRSDFESALAVNFWGAYNAVEAVLPSMRARGEGRIINISSIGGKLAVPHLAPYCVGKFALVSYSQSLRAELAADGIVVTTICPGLMRTGSPRNALFKGNHDAEYTWFKISASLPLLTVSAEQAAHEILDACRRGDAEHILSIPAKVGALANNLLPELTSTLLALTNRLLPGDDNADGQAKLGKECKVAPVLAPLTAPTDEAAIRNNEIDLEQVHALEHGSLK